MIIFLCVLVLFLLLLHSRLKFEIRFVANNEEKKILHYDYQFSITVIYFRKLMTIDRQDIDKWLQKRRKKNNTRSKKGRNKRYLNYINRFISLFEIEELITYVRVGTIANMTTVFTVPLIATLLSYVYSRYHIAYSPNCYFTVKPVFDKFELASKVHCIISTKVVNIIYIIFLLWNERRKKNGRTSNRGAYEYCYE